MQEIERKFLVSSESFKNEAVSEKKIIQGFLNTHPERTVRVRLYGDQGVLTVKGISTNDGTSRFEWEKNISEEDAKNLLALCEPGVIEKIRYEIKVGSHTFEVDVFEGTNAGLIIAEIELADKNESFIKPTWLGEEVTGQVEYYNARLSQQPYKNWK